MVAFLHVNALVMALEIGLANKLLVAVVDRAREGVLALLIVRLHVRLEVVASAEHLAASLNLAHKVGLLLGGQPAGRSPWPLNSVLPPGIMEESRGLRSWRAWVELLRLNRVVVRLVPGC